MKTLKICLVILCLLHVRAVGTPQFSGANFFMAELKIKTKNYGVVTVQYDEDDEFIVSKHIWRVKPIGNHLYAITGQQKEGRKIIKMHRLITMAEPMQVIDHRDGDTLNNKKSNLRKCTSKENSRNSGLRKNNTTGYKGVSLYKSNGKFMAAIMVDFKNKNQGYFKTAKEAAIAYNNAAIRYFGEYARLNVIEND